MPRKIIHIDMDAFFAAVEQRDAPQLKGLPVVVGGQPGSRGVVATCSYEARKFGIHSAMPSSHAYQLCPQAIFVAPRFAAYKQASEDIHKVFKQVTDIIEPLSLDEAYLDVSHVDLCDGSATLMAQNIRREIFQQTELTASAGISYNKFLAKLASDQNKPNGQCVIRPGESDAFLKKLPIGRFYGVGKVTQAKMHGANIKTGADLKSQSLLALQNLFGNSAQYYYDISRGLDNREVSQGGRRKSLGAETTFQADLTDYPEMLQQLMKLSTGALNSLAERELLAYRVTIKVKYADFIQVTRSYTGATVISSQDKTNELIKILLAKTEAKHRPVRLLGLAFSKLVDKKNVNESFQLSLFE